MSAALKPCPKCDDCAYPLEVEEEGRHITIWHCGCAQITYTIATRAEPEHEQGQRALELLRDYVSACDDPGWTPGMDPLLIEKAKALLEASDEQHPKP